MAKIKHKRISIAGIICNVLGIAILLAVIALCLPMVVPKAMGNDVYNVVSGSMEPEIPVGSLVLVAPVEGEDLEVGDIAAFTNGGSVITHRVVENNIYDGSIITKGDANVDNDAEPVYYENIIGKVTWHIPVIGAYMQILTSTIGKIYLLGTALCGVLFIILAGRLSD